MGREEARGLTRGSILLMAVAVLIILLAVSLASGTLERLYNIIGSNTTLIRSMTAFLMMLTTNSPL